MSRVLSQLLFAAWCLFFLLVAFWVFAFQSLPDVHDRVVAGLCGVGYLALGALLFKGGKFTPKHFLPRIAALKRDGFSPDCELLAADNYAGFSRPQGRAVFLQAKDKSRHEFALSELAGADRVQRDGGTFIHIRTHRLETPLIPLRVPAPEADHWLAKIKIVLSQPSG